MKFMRPVVPVTAGALFLTGWAATPALADDTTAPDASITSPALQDEVYGRRALTFQGTATDDTGVASVGVAIQDRDTRLWYRPDGTWGAYHRYSATLSAPGAASTGWSFTWTPAEPGAYMVQAVAKDAAGHPDAELPWRRFDVDTQAPDTAISRPTALTTTVSRNTTVSLNGTATDDHGVRYILVAIQNKATGKWLRTGGTWGSIMWHRRAVTRPGAPSTTWTTSQKMSVSGTFIIRIGSEDRAGLVDPSTPYRQYVVR
ncbi:hypothetical protein DPM19_30700 [Actinomadura craniellae]|uniref:Bacterial Ig-like domain-containing protein n=1 Tax=Actinomadura craniellae TaxID=2231787 RepID=A0A365GX52_9ACTN|nr:Ig-like domain-containing protein [Actinomadura craniellae]RAY11396.1 hypothetical protein DPM19_30700 [Actinomadura craniellae]